MKYVENASRWAISWRWAETWNMETLVRSAGSLTPLRMMAGECWEP